MSLTDVYEELTGPLSIGKLLHAYRITNDLSLEDMASKLSIPSIYLSKLEEEVMEPDLKDTLKFAVCLHEDEDFYGCLTLQNYNKSRTVRGLSPIEQDSNLCYIAKILANSINSMPKNYKFNFSLLYQDEVFDKYNGGYDSKGNYNDWRQIYYQYDTYSNIENSQIETTQKEIAETLGRSTREDGETFDKGCFRFSRYEDGNFVLVTVLGQRK
jgi:transcriptional regulator with XRE-family HTH domain